MGDARPHPERDGHEDSPLREIDIPDPVNPPTGCRFHTRCPEAREVCRTTPEAFVSEDANATEPPASASRRPRVLEQRPDRRGRLTADRWRIDDDPFILGFLSHHSCAVIGAERPRTNRTLNHGSSVADSTLRCRSTTSKRSDSRTVRGGVTTKGVTPIPVTHPSGQGPSRTYSWTRWPGRRLSRWDRGDERPREHVSRRRGPTRTRANLATAQPITTASPRHAHGLGRRSNRLCAVGRRRKALRRPRLSATGWPPGADSGLRQHDGR